MNTTILIVQKIFLQYIKENRFEFQSVYNSNQAISELLGILQELIMCAKEKMHIKEIMQIFANEIDETIQNQFLDLNQLQNIQKQIKKFKFQKENNIYKEIQNLIASFGGCNV